MMNDKHKGTFKPGRINKQNKDLNGVSAASASASKDAKGGKSGNKKEGGPGKKKTIQFMRKEEGIETIKYHAHWGWVTKLKYYEDLNCIMSSSLDGFIHMHDLETLTYKPRRTFNLH